MCTLLLEYCVSDLDAHSPAVPEALAGLPLLAIDNRMLEINYRDTAASVLYIMSTEEAKVLTQMEHSILFWTVIRYFYPSLGPMHMHLHLQPQCIDKSSHQCHVSLHSPSQRIVMFCSNLCHVNSFSHV